MRNRQVFSLNRDSILKSVKKLKRLCSKRVCVCHSLPPADLEHDLCDMFVEVDKRRIVLVYR